MKCIVGSSGKMEFNFFDLVAQLDVESKKDLGRSLLWDEEMFRTLVEEIATGYGTPTYNSLIHEARLKLAELLPDLSKTLVNTLIAEIQDKEKAVAQNSSWAWKLWHWVTEMRPDLSWSEIPGPPKFIANAIKYNECLAKEIRERTGFEFKEGQWIKSV